ncbi:hypothetical protein ACP4OV_022153 [Aristida adscensionis]
MFLLISVKLGGFEELAEAMGQNNAWEADKMLDSYIYDYLLKRNMQDTAKAFQAEVNVSSEPVVIDAPGGFLLEWWSVFWDIFIARTSEKHSDAAASYLESIKTREQQQPLQQHIQMHQLLLQRHVQQQQQQQESLQQEQQQQQRSQQQRHQRKQQQRDEESSQFLTSAQNALVFADSPMQPNVVAVSSLSAKIYEGNMKVPTQRDASVEASMKQKFTESVGQLLDSNPTSMLKSAAISAQASGQIFHGTAGGVSGSLQQAQARNQRLQGPTQDIKAGTNGPLNPRTTGVDGPFTGLPGSNQAGNNLTLKGWPLTGIEQFRTGFLQQKSFMQSPQSLHHLQFLTPHQQQLLLQAQQNITSSPGEIDSRHLQMLFSSGNLAPGRDAQSNAFAEIIPSVGSSSLQNMYSPVQRMETDIVAKQIAALHQHQQSSNQQQLLHHPLLNQQPQSSNPNTGEQEMGAVTIAMHGDFPRSCGNDKVSKSRNGRKRKQPISSPCPGNSSGTTHTAGPSPSSSPSTPAQSPGDTMSMPSRHDDASLSKALIIYGTDAPLSIRSPTNKIVDMDHFVGDDCLEDNVELFKSHDDTDPGDVGNQFTDSKEFIFQEIFSAQGSTKRVVCCHFSSDGKLLATGSHDNKVVLWNSETLKRKSVLEEHSLPITDVRFSSSTPRVATSSCDKTVRVWDADNQGYSIRTFTGHLASPMSVDFHPNKDDLICSCDVDSEIRFWSIRNGTTIRVFKGGSTQVRFQPRLGGCLAAASDNVVSILDVETRAIVRRFELALKFALCQTVGHVKRVNSLCWDPSGEYVVSVGEDAVKVWSLNAGSNESCTHELSCSGRKFTSCAFHPTYPSLLVIGSYQLHIRKNRGYMGFPYIDHQTLNRYMLQPFNLYFNQFAEYLNALELWDMAENRTMTVAAHDGLVSAVDSSSTGLVASTSHDKCVKLWR